MTRYTKVVVVAALAVSVVVLAGATPANAGGAVAVGWGGGGVAVGWGGGYYRPAPVYYAPAPVYYSAPVYYAPAPVYYAPAPVYYAPTYYSAPVYYRPAPVYYGRGGYYRGGDRDDRGYDRGRDGGHGHDRD